MYPLDIHLFNHFQILYDGQTVTANLQPRLQSLLAYLLLHRTTPLSRQQLAFLFWPDTTEAQAHTNLRNVLYQLRRVLPFIEDFLTITTKTVHWQGNREFTLDVAEFCRGFVPV